MVYFSQILMSVITVVINASMSARTRMAVLCVPAETVLNLTVMGFPVEVSEPQH